MVFWCKNCGAFLGVHKPLADWHTDRNALCQQCASDPSLRLRDYLTKKPHASSEEVVAALANVGTAVNMRMVEYVRQFLPAPGNESANETHEALHYVESEETAIST
jgi:hypothetical protein